MKLFTDTRYYKFFAPFLLNLVANHSARDYWARIVLAFVLGRTLESLVDLIEPILGAPAEGSWQYYGYLAAEALRYGCWFWSIWYGLVQIIDLVFQPTPKAKLYYQRQIPRFLLPGYLLCA